MMRSKDARCAVEAIRAEYREMPGLSLTQEQAARLLGLDCLRVMAALNELERAGFLMRTRMGQFVRGDTLLRGAHLGPPAREFEAIRERRSGTHG